MKHLLLILTLTAVTSSFAQLNLVDEWQIYDTLSIEQTKLGNMVLNKVKLLHKRLSIAENGVFYLKHIEPKGFAIDADIQGKWKIDGDKLLLEYEDEFEDQQGKKKIKTVVDELLIVNDNRLVFYQNEEEFAYQRLTE